MTFDSPVLTLESEGHVATLWLDRVDARNAMGRDLWRDLPRAAAAVAERACAACSRSATAASCRPM